MDDRVMTLDEVLLQIKDRGIEMRADGDELQCRPKAGLTPELRLAIRTHKGELLERLRTRCAEEGSGSDFEHLLGFTPKPQAVEALKSMMQVFDGELLHRWDTGQIVEKDRLLDRLVYCGDAGVELDPEVDVQPVDLSGTTAAELGDVIDAILTVLLVVCKGPEDKAAVLEGRLGFCEAFDALPYGIRKEAVKSAHDIPRRSPRERRDGLYEHGRKRKSKARVLGPDCDRAGRKGIL
jgi:hypothetical protein